MELLWWDCKLKTGPHAYLTANVLSDVAGAVQVEQHSRLELHKYTGHETINSDEFWSMSSTLTAHSAVQNNR